MLADTDSRNVSCRIQIQIVKNVTISPDNRYLAGYPCIPKTNPKIKTPVLGHEKTVTETKF